MPESVIVDDGGSTRIKWNNGGLGNMPKLLDVDEIVGLGMGSMETISSSPSQVLVVYQDQDGIAHNMTPKAFPLNKEVFIYSQLGQKIRLKRTDNQHLQITVYSGNSEPLVEAKQRLKKRRYIVANSGAIEKVTVDGQEVYNIEGDNQAPTEPAGINKPVLYTSVVLA